MFFSKTCQNAGETQLANRARFLFYFWFFLDAALRKYMQLNNSQDFAFGSGFSGQKALMQYMFRESGPRAFSKILKLVFFRESGLSGVLFGDLVLPPCHADSLRKVLKFECGCLYFTVTFREEDDWTQRSTASTKQPRPKT